MDGQRHVSAPGSLVNRRVSAQSAPARGDGGDGGGTRGGAWGSCGGRMALIPAAMASSLPDDPIGGGAGGVGRRREAAELPEACGGAWRRVRVLWTSFGDSENTGQWVFFDTKPMVWVVRHRNLI